MSKEEAEQSAKTYIDHSFMGAFFNTMVVIITVLSCCACCINKAHEQAELTERIQEFPTTNNQNSYGLPRPQQTNESFEESTAKAN